MVPMSNKPLFNSFGRENTIHDPKQDGNALYTVAVWCKSQFLKFWDSVCPKIRKSAIKAIKAIHSCFMSHLLNVAVALPCHCRRPEPNTDKTNTASREVLSHVLQSPTVYGR